MDSVFFAIAKIAWFLIRPETLLVLLLAVGLLLVWAGRRGGIATLWACLTLCVVIGLLPVATPIFRPLEARFPAEPDISPDPLGIIVLGGGEEIGPPGAPPQLNLAGERYLEAIVLARRYREAVVMFTGGRASLDGGEGNRARHAAELFSRAGIQRDRIVLEPASRNTAENAANSLPLRPVGTEAGPWVLVTSAWHMPRSVATFCAAGWEGIVPWPADYRGEDKTVRWNFALRLDALNTATKEWIGLLGYWIAGRTDTLWPEGCPPAGME